MQSAHADALPPLVVYGCGSIGRRHLRVFERLIPGRILGVPVRRERLQPLRAEGVHAIAVDDIPPAVLGSVVATDTGRHLTDVERLLEIGPVLCEKPLVANRAELSVLHQICAGARHPVFCGYSLRFDKSLRTFAKHLQRIGSLHTVRVECESYLPDWRPGTDHRLSYSARADDGGVARDLSHEIDYAVMLFGQPKGVSAVLRATSRLGIESDDTADLMWTARNGVVVTIHLNYLTRNPRRMMRAVGTNGEILWDGVLQRVTVTLPENIEEFDCAESRDEMYFRQAKAFLAACAGESPDTLATLEEAAFVVELLDAARYASRSGTNEPIPLTRGRDA